jgi:Ca2+-binding RTX toxin-like protein
LLAVSAMPVLAAPAPSESGGAEALPSAADFAQALAEGEARRQAEAKAREEELASPKAQRERDVSRTAYVSISGAEAQSLLAEAFPEQLRELDADPARVVSGADVEKTLGPHVARVANGEGGSALLESPVPIEVGEGPGKAPVDLSLERIGAGYAPENPLADVELPDAASGAIKLPGGIALTDLPGAADPSAHRFGEEDLFFPSAALATDTLVAPKTDGVEIFEQVRSPESPERFRYPLALPKGAELRSDGQGGAEVVGADGRVIAGVPAPTATDAQGTDVPASLSVEGDAVVVELDHRFAEIAYPVLLDPEFRLIFENATSGTSLGFWSPASTGPYELSRAFSGAECPFGFCFGAGLYAQARGNVFLGAESFGQWVFQAPGTTGYFRQADFSSINFNVPSKCSSEVEPHGYVGIFNVASNSFEGRLDEFHSATTGGFFGREMSPDTNLRVAAAGIGTHVNKTPPCPRAFFLGGASFVYEDSDNPTLTVTSSPSGPVGETPLPIEVSTSDQGFGVSSILVEAKGKGGETKSWSTPTQLGCIGTRSNECPHAMTLPVTYEPSALPEGKDTLTLTAFDAAGSPSASQSVTITVDRTPPDTLIDTGPAAGEAISGVTAAFTYHSTEAGSTFECKLDSGAFAPCAAAGFTTPTLAAGSHTFSVRAKDQVGNVDGSPASRSFFSGAPDTAIDSGPSGLIATRTPSFTYHSTIAGSTFACSVDGGAFASCPATGFTTAALGDGPHTFAVRATTSGVTDPTPATRSFTVDATAPDTLIDTGPAAGEAISGVTAAFTYHSTEAGSTFECKLDSGAFAPCAAAGFTTPTLAAGSHTFSVRAKDQVGNVDGSPASRSFFSGAPDTAIDSGPSGLIATRTPSFTYHSTIAGSTFACSVDGGAFASCPATGFTTAALGDGPHTFAVRATTSGVTDPTPATRSFTVDATAPQTTIEFGTEGLVGSEIADFVYSSDDPEAHFECKLDGTSFAACDPEEFESQPLPDGPHSFAVRAIDAIGNVDPTPANREFTIDATSPTVKIESGPEGPTAIPRPTFTFAATGGGTLSCAIEAEGSEREEPAYRSCAGASSDQPATPLPDGTYTFFVHTIDAAENEDLDSRSFTIDTVAPQTTIDSGPAAITDDPRPSFAFSADEPGASFRCRFDAEAFRPCSGPDATDTPATSLADGAHSFEVKATDVAGNADPTPAVRSFTVETEAPQTTIVSGPVGAIDVTSATFKYSASGQRRGLFFECQLDDEGFAPCGQSAEEFIGLSEGEHRFEVRAERNGVDPTPAERSFVVDTSPPSVPVVSGALRDPNVPGLTLHLEVNDGNSSSPVTIRSGAGEIRVLVDGTVVATANAPCENNLCAASEVRDLQLPYQQVLGTHHFVVEGKDGVGHFSPLVAWDETTDAAETVEPAEPPIPKGGCPKAGLNEEGFVRKPHAILGTPCSDLIVVTAAGKETIEGFGGNDVIIGGPGKDRIKGGPGNDRIRARRSNDEVFGEGDDDVIYGGVGDDVLQGGPGDDVIDGGPGFDGELGEGGNDLLRGGQGGDGFHGGGGTDTVSYADAVPSTHSEIPSVTNFPGFPGNEPGVKVDLSAPTPFAIDGEIEEGGGEDKPLEGIEKIVGSPFSDYIVGSAADETIDGGPGADFISGGGGTDAIASDPRDYHEGEGQKTFAARDQSKIEIGTYTGKVGAAEKDLETDVYLLGSSLADAVHVNYLAAADDVQFTAANSNVAARFETGGTCRRSSKGSLAVNCPLSEGGLGAVLISGGAGDDLLRLEKEAVNGPGSFALLGGPGQDRLLGGVLEEMLVDGEIQGSSPGREELLAGGGDDEVIQGVGADEVQGGPGNDLLISSDICHGDVVFGDVRPQKGPPVDTGSDNAQFHPLEREGVFADLQAEELGEVGNKNHTCAGGGFEKLSEANVLEASRNSDILEGTEGTNLIIGRGQPDVILARGGADQINARDGLKDARVSCGPGKVDVAHLDFEQEVVSGHLEETEKHPIDTKEKDCEATNKNSPSYEEEGKHFGPQPKQAQGAIEAEAAEEEEGGEVEPGPPILGPVAEAIPVGPSPMTYLRLDETEGTIATNTAGPPATYEAAGIGPSVNGPGPTLGEPGALVESEGEVGQGSHAIALDGSSAYVDLASQGGPSEGSSGAYSVAMFVKFSRAPGQREYLFSSSEGGEGTLLYRDPAGKIVFATGTESGAPQVTSSEAIDDESWHFLVGTLEGHTITLYLDGFRYVLGYGESVLPKLAGAPQSLIGAGPGLTDFLDAQVDEFASFDGALSEAEVFADMAGSQAQPPELILPPAPETSDLDKDGVTDGLDNCPEVANSDQSDVDENGIGDACEAPDGDGDGVPDATDNCPHSYNPDQADANGDGIGDECALLPPTASTEAASALKGTSATLNASVNPGGLATAYQFEYGTTSEYGTSVPLEAKAIGSGASAVAVSEAISNLTPGTTYHFRVVATNEAGASEGTDQTFTTLKPPSATTEAASAIVATGATLNALVNPEGSPTTYQFEYGPTNAYGSTAPVLPKEAGTGMVPLAIGEVLSGLQPSITYHYRVVARSAGGTTNGLDRTFTTPPPPVAAQLEAIATTEPFNGSSSSLANFAANFAKLGWATEKGEDSTSGWHPIGAFPAVNGASYSPVLTDAGFGVAAEATLAANPGNAERYFSLWLDMPNPQGSTRVGYELRATDTAPNTYTLTISKWQSGTQAVLATKAGVGLLNANSLAIVDQGAKVSAWTNAGQGFAQVLSAEDSTFASGGAGFEGAGNITRLVNFKGGALAPL